MIIACPSCSARYVVDPAKIGRAGRTVKCAKCAHAWVQPAPTPDEMAEAPAALAEPAAERATASPTESNLAGAIRNRIGAEAREPDDNGDVGGDEFRARFDDAFQRNPEPVARPLRGGSSSNLPALQKEPRRWTARLAWIALIVFVAGIIGGAVLFQDSITKSWPASKRLYDLISVSDGSMKKKTRRPQRPVHLSDTDVA